MATNLTPYSRASVAHRSVWEEVGWGDVLKVLVPLLLGGAIYLVFRDWSGLVMGLWIPWSFSGPLATAPDWLVYNLPDGLWLYASLQLLRIIWGTPIPRASYPWFAAVLLLAFGSELLQGFHLLSGTGDWGDVVAYVVGGSIPFLNQFSLSMLNTHNS